MTGEVSLTRPQLARLMRRHVTGNLYDESNLPAAGVALYALADPRDIRAIRYIGQTALPRRRFLQHLNTAKLWLPDERPWWVTSPQLRPLYEWIRELFRDGCRMPAMVVSSWVPCTESRQAERALIYQCLSLRLPLLNIEAQAAGAQMQLL